jgi:YfiH family protein
MKARTYFTDRCGGVSSGSYSELNLATHVGDKLDDVLINREKFAHLLGVEKSHVYYMNQVHGHAISVITPLSDSTLAPSVDALFTTEPGRALVVLTADCIPLLLTSDRAVAAVHVGRKGLVERIAVETIKIFHSHGIASEEITATMGASICRDCYEVDLPMYDDVVKQIPECATTREKHTLDLISGLEAQLAEFGMKATIDRRCTCEDPNLFSYRRDDATGRQASAVILE